MIIVCNLGLNGFPQEYCYYFLKYSFDHRILSVKMYVNEAILQIWYLYLMVSVAYQLSWSTHDDDEIMQGFQTPWNELKINEQQSLQMSFF